MPEPTPVEAVIAREEGRLAWLISVQGPERPSVMISELRRNTLAPFQSTSGCPVSLTSNTVSGSFTSRLGALRIRVPESL